MRIKSFQDIIAWQKAKDLTLDLYKSFAQVKDFSFRDQLLRAAVSVMNNIAEGFAFSDKKFSQYLDIAKGSCYEVQSMLILAKELGYVSKTKYEQFSIQTNEISKVITGLIKSLSRFYNSVD